MAKKCPQCNAPILETHEPFCSLCRAKPRHSSTGPFLSDLANQERVTDIAGAEGLTWAGLAEEVRNGGRLVVFQYCVSVVIASFLQASRVHLIRANESAALRGLSYTFLSFITGWWGIPWGFVYTPTAIITNLSGGKDVTEDVLPNSWRH